jgi:hypothetical protein
MGVQARLINPEPPCLIWSNPHKAPISLYDYERRRAPFVPI